MKKRRVTWVKSKAISLLLALCMVFTGIPGNDLAVYAADPPAYYIGNTEITLDSDATDAAWSWAHEGKILTFKKRCDIPAIQDHCIVLPGDSTIVLNDGVRVMVSSGKGEAIVCEGALTIIGNGAIQIYGASAYPDHTGSALKCGGRLTFGDEITKPYLYAAARPYDDSSITGQPASDKVIQIDSEAYEGLDNPAVLMKNGQIIFAGSVDTNGKFFVKNGTKAYVKLEGESVLQDRTMKSAEATSSVCANCTVVYGKKGTLGEHYYYGTNGYHRYVKYDCASRSKEENLRVLIGSDIDLTVTGSEDTFLGWSTTKDGSAGILSRYIMPGPDKENPTEDDYKQIITLENAVVLYPVYSDTANKYAAVPTAAVNYKTGKLTGLAKGKDYIIIYGETSVSVSADENGEIEIKSEYGEEFSIKQAADGEIGESKEAQTIKVLETGDAPTLKDFTITSPTADKPTNIKAGSADISYEYKKDKETEWTALPETGVDVDGGSFVEIRKAGTDTSPASKAFKITVEATPTPGVNYKDAKITGLTSGGTYTITAGDVTLSDKATSEDGTVSVPNLSDYCGKEIQIVKKGNGTDTCDSAAATVTLEKKPTAPDSSKYTVSQAVNGSTQATVAGIAATEEYSEDNGTTWKSGDGTEKKIQAGNTAKKILVRTAATADKPASESAEVTIKAAQTQAEKPKASIHYLLPGLKGLNPGGTYTVTVGDGTSEEKQADSDGKITISDLQSNEGKNISVIAKGDGDTTYDSEAQTLLILTRGDAPSKDDFEVEDPKPEAYETSTDTTVKKITGKYEYRLEDGDWTDGNGSAVAVAEGKKIQIRVKVTEDAPESQILTIKAKTLEATPKPGVNYKDSKLTGLDAGGTYTVTSGSTTLSDSVESTDGTITVTNLMNYYNKTVQVVKIGDGTDTCDSKAATIKWAARPAAPEKSLFPVTEATKDDSNAYIKGITSDYQYSKGAENWVAGSAEDAQNGIKVVGGQHVYIRHVATEDAPESESCMIETKPAPNQEERPQAVVNYKGKKLTNLLADAKYTIQIESGDIKEYTADSKGEILLENLSLAYGQTISVIKKASDATRVDSAPQKIRLNTTEAAVSPDPKSYKVDQAVGGKQKATITGIKDTEEYSEDGGKTWKSGDGTPKEVAAGTDILIRTAATDDTPESSSITITTQPAQTQEDTPENAAVDYTIPALTGLVKDKEYVVKDGDDIVVSGKADENGSLPFGDVLSYAGKELSVVQKGNGTTTYDSDPKTVLIASKGSAPSKDDFEIVDPTGEKTSTTVKNIGDEYEYRIGDGEWTDGDGSDVEVPAGETIEIRKKATESAPESESLKIQAKSEVVKTPEEKPESAAADYTIPGLTGLKPGEKYEVTADGKVIASGEADETGKLAIADLLSNAGKEISVVKKGNGETTTDSEPKVILIASKGSAPSKDDFEIVDPTGEKTSTTVKNIGDEYEYRIGDGEWTDGDGSDVEVPAGETIEIRKKATESAPESESVKIKAEDVITKTPEETPKAGIDYKAEQLTGLAPNAEYVIKVDGKTVIVKADAAGKTDLGAYYGKTISIVKKGNGTTTEDSAEQKLTILAKETAPSDDQFDVMPDENGGNVVIKNVSADYEYSTNNGLSWTTGSGKDVVVPVGTIVLIRRKATATSPASATVVIKTTAYPTLATVDKQITGTNTDKGDVAGSTFAPISLKGTGKSKSVKLTWKKVKDATGYIVYGSACGKDNKMVKLTTLGASKKSYTVKKLKGNTYYKYMVVAYKTIDGKDYVISKSKVAHVSTTQKAKYGNPKKISIKKTKVTIKKGKKKTIKPKLVLTKKKMRKHIAKFRYESADPTVATVTKKGVVKGVKKGKTYVYVYAQNGVYKKIKVTVK